jgi:hypothetical protein
MTKRLFITLFIAVNLFASCGGGSSNKSKESTKSEEQKSGETVKPTNDLQKELIAGRLVSVRQRVYWCLEKFGRLEKGRLQNMPASDYLKVFDEHGFLTEEVHYGANDKIVNMRKLTYTENYLLETEEIYNGENLVTRTVNAYDEKLRISKKETFDNAGKVKSKIEYNYNDEKNESDEDNYDSAGKLVSKYVNKYSKELTVERAKYWGGGTLALKEFYNYEAGKLVETVFFKGREETFDKRIIYGDYAGNNYRIKTVYNSDEAAAEKTFYSYDKTGNLLSYVTYVNSATKKKPDNTDAPDTIIESEEIENENTENENTENEGTENLIQEENILLFKGTGNIYSYSFDEQGNWIQKISYKIDRSFEAESFDKLNGSTNLSEGAVRQFYYERSYTYKTD